MLQGIVLLLEKQKLYLSLDYEGHRLSLTGKIIDEKKSGKLSSQ